MASRLPPQDEIDDDAAIEAAAAEDAFGLANLAGPAVGGSSEAVEGSSRKMTAVPVGPAKRAAVANPEVLTEVRTSSIASVRLFKG